MCHYCMVASCVQPIAMTVSSVPRELAEGADLSSWVMTQEHDKFSSWDDGLQARSCQPDFDNTLMIATAIFESSVTLDVNGIIDCGPFEEDMNGFLHPVQNTAMQSKRGRVARFRPRNIADETLQ